RSIRYVPRLRRPSRRRSPGRKSGTESPWASSRRATCRRESPGWEIYGSRCFRSEAGSTSMRSSDVQVQDCAAWGVPDTASTLPSVAQEFSNPLEVLDVIADGLHDHQQRHREQHSPDIPHPSPEEQSDEYRDCI